VIRTAENAENAEDKPLLPSSAFSATSAVNSAVSVHLSASFFPNDKPLSRMV